MRECEPPFFEPCDAPPMLTAGEIHVCWLRAHAPFDHRSVAAGGRSVLERLLCRYAGLAAPPPIARGAHGKPFAPSLPGLDFNLSHSGGDVLLAFALAQPLGIDLEHADRRLRVDNLAERFFAAEEAAALAHLPDGSRRGAFLQLWTAKEAVLKALGEGIGFGLDRLAFALSPNGRAGALARIAPEAGEVAQWRVRRLDPAPGLFGALAWRGPERRVRCFLLAG